MKKALVILKGGESMDLEYSDIQLVFTMLEHGRFVTFGKRSIPVDDIRAIEWID